MSDEKTIRISSGAPWEDLVGYSRAVRKGNMIYVSGTAPVRDGLVVGVGDPYRQAVRCLRIITHAIEEALFLGTEIIVMSPRPGRIVRRYRLDFVHRFAGGEDAAAVRSDPTFIALREEIRTLIHNTGRRRHERPQLDRAA